MRVNTAMVKKKAMDECFGPMVALTLANSRQTSYMELAPISGATEDPTKVSGPTLNSMASAYSNGVTDEFTKANMRQI